MHQIDIVLPSFQDEYLIKIFQTKEFKNLFENNYFFQIWRSKLKQAPIFFFNASSDKARNHLTSIFRFISRRSYANLYIQDLYYFHELCHCAHYNPDEFPLYKDWSFKLSNNELYASLMSEAFIYFMDKSLLDKTFKDLWINKFILNHQNKTFDVNGFPINQDSFNDLQYTEKIKDNKWNAFDLSSHWPESIHYIIRERNRLRSLDCFIGLDEASATIVKYNNIHKEWILKWKAHYITIDSLLIGLLRGVLTPEDYVAVVLQNCDELGRPFYPKKNKFSYH